MAEAALSFFAIIDPLGNVLVFHLFTARLAGRQKLIAALVAVSAAFALLLVFSLAGGEVLSFLGISRESFQVAAGLLLVPPAYSLVSEGQPMRLDREPSGDPLDFALVPMATPLIAGPGAMAAATSFADSAGTWTTIGAFTLVLALSLLMLAGSAWIFRFLGEPVLRLAARVVGILLFAIAVDFVLDGALKFVELS